MSLAKAETVPLTSSAIARRFFRQSGWLMIANIGGGALMWAVHFLNRFLPTVNTGVSGVPGISDVAPNIRSKCADSANCERLAHNTQRELSGIIRMFLLAAGVVWLVGAIIIFCFQKIFSPI